MRCAAMMPRMSFFCSGLAARRGGGRGAGRGGRRALAAGVAVDLVVVADVEDVLVPLGRGGEGGHPDVVGAAVARPADHPRLLAVQPGHAGEAGGDRGGRGEGGEHGGRAQCGVGEGAGRHRPAAGRDDELDRPRLHRAPEELQRDRHAAAAAVGVAGAEQGSVTRRPARPQHRSLTTAPRSMSGRLVDAMRSSSMSSARAARRRRPARPRSPAPARARGASARASAQSTPPRPRLRSRSMTATRDGPREEAREVGSSGNGRNMRTRSEPTRSPRARAASTHRVHGGGRWCPSRPRRSRSRASSRR